MKNIFALAIFLLLAASVSSTVLRKELRKQLAGPPSEFGAHDLPLPTQQTQQEYSAFFQSTLKVSKNKRESLYSSFLLSVDSSSNFTFAVVSKHLEKLQLSLTNPKGEAVDISKAGIKDEFPIGELEAPTLVFQFQNPIVGEWQLKLTILQSSIESSLFESIALESDPNVAVLLFNQNGAEIFTHLTTYFTHTGNEIGLMAKTMDNDLLGNSRVLLSNSLIAVMDVTSPDGKSIQVMMNDEGRGLDAVAGDGSFAGSINADEVGNYKFKAEIRGNDHRGVNFVRTSQHLVNVIDKKLTMNGKVGGKVDEKNSQRIEIQIGVSIESNKLAAALNKHYRAYAEVWGVNEKGDAVAVCWIGGMTSVEESNGEKFVGLSLDLNWVALANAKGPFTLKNIYIADPISQIPEDFQASLQLNFPQLVSHISSLSLSPSSISKEMRVGRIPESVKSRGGKSGLVLLHGYCSSENPWNSTADVWTNPHYFLNPSASITNEEFAQKVVEYAESEGLDSYSIIGHSQGGQVATHIINYYFTGMDNLDPSKRVIQSVGTPYGGSGAAGTLASIGSVVGIGCGSNFDLSHDGSVLWQSGISSSARKAVHYYTTTYKLGGWFGDWCSLPMNMVLEWPNDGTTELDYATLEGAVNEGNTMAQCHINDMRYFAQTSDRNRNTVMNAKAASTGSK